jgi:hypothetical protein
VPTTAELIAISALSDYEQNDFFDDLDMCQFDKSSIDQLINNVAPLPSCPFK